MSNTKNLPKYLLLVAIVYASSYVGLVTLRYALRSEYPLVVVEGVSMQPTFYEGDLLAIKGVENKLDIIPLDIIVFYEPESWYGNNRLIVHRVVQRIVSNTSVEFVTKGDNNRSPDPWIVRETDVVGVVVWRIPFLGSIVIMIQTPFGNVLVVTLIVLIIAISLFYDRSGNNNKQKIVKNSFIRK